MKRRTDWRTSLRDALRIEMLAVAFGAGVFIAASFLGAWQSCRGEVTTSTTVTEGQAG